MDSYTTPRLSFIRIVTINLLILTTQQIIHASTQPKVTSIPQPRTCITRWSGWLNRQKPDGTNGDYEKMSPEELQQFCPGGTITDIQCQTTSRIPHYNTGAILTCTNGTGLICNNADNFPVGCEDYLVRYQCVCTVTEGTDRSTLSPLHGTSTSTKQTIKEDSVATWKIILLTVAALILLWLCCSVIFLGYVKCIKGNGKRKIEDINSTSKSSEEGLHIADVL